MCACVHVCVCVLDMLTEILTVCLKVTRIFTWPSPDFAFAFIINIVFSGNGVIDFIEFLEMVAKMTKNVDETIKEAFYIFDSDGSGSITCEEFRDVMTSQGAKLSEVECNEIIAEADADGDGEINLEGGYYTFMDISNSFLEIIYLF